MLSITWAVGPPIGSKVPGPKCCVTLEGPIENLLVRSDSREFGVPGSFWPPGVVGLLAHRWGPFLVTDSLAASLALAKGPLPSGALYKLD